MTFQDLVDDILIRILCTLSLGDVLSVRQVNPIPIAFYFFRCSSAHLLDPLDIEAASSYYPSARDMARSVPLWSPFQGPSGTRVRYPSSRNTYIGPRVAYTIRHPSTEGVDTPSQTTSTSATQKYSYRTTSCPANRRTRTSHPPQRYDHHLAP